MILFFLLLLAQGPAILQVQLWLPEGTQDRGVPLRIVSESREGRLERVSFSSGHCLAFFHLEELVARAAGPWHLWIGENEEPETGPLLLPPGSIRNLVVDLREYAFPLIHQITSGWNALVEIVDSRSLRVLGSYSPPAYSAFPLPKEPSGQIPNG